MEFPRASGVLLHPTSLPGRFGIGDLGPQADRFVNFLKNAGQTYWQILPLGPTGYGDSPYQCYSAFAGNTLLVSPEILAEDRLISREDLANEPAIPEDRVDYGRVHESKNRFLSRAFDEFSRTAHTTLETEFKTFQRENAWWLDDYALYRAVKAEHDHAAWYEWPTSLKFRETLALAEASARLTHQISAQKFFQFLFFRQWDRLRKVANDAGVKLIGDLPIFVALDSCDVWCNQDQFKLNADGSPKVVAGVPPDFFSKTGQLWGNPIYDWGAMQRDDFSWWRARVAYTLRTVNIVRVDHFRGFVGAWEVPGTDKTAEKGEWSAVPGAELFASLFRHLGPLPVIAEDLGVITPEVRRLRDENGFPGMKVLQFAFGGDARNYDLPHNHVRNCVAYTGTHDNDTALGWWRSLAGGKEDQMKTREYCLRYLNTKGSEMNWDLIRAAWASVAHTAIAPLQDVLGVGAEGRMNLPASTGGNWSWRYRQAELTDEHAERLSDLTQTYGRVVEGET